VKLHKRTLPVNRSGAKLTDMLWKFQDDHELTYVEMLRLLIEHQQRITKYMLRDERHPEDPNHKADEE